MSLKVTLEYPQNLQIHIVRPSILSSSADIWASSQSYLCQQHTYAAFFSPLLDQISQDDWCLEQESHILFPVYIINPIKVQLFCSITWSWCLQSLSPNQCDERKSLRGINHKWRRDAKNMVNNTNHSEISELWWSCEVHLPKGLCRKSGERL